MSLIPKMSCGFFACFTILLSISFFASKTEAGTFCISTPADLQAALTNASTNGQDDVIQIIQGAYYGNFTYISSETYSLTIEGGYTDACAARLLDPSNTVLDAAGLEESVLMLSSTQGAPAFSVEGLTLQNGWSGGGGGLSALTNGEVTLTENIIINNYSFQFGGGAYVDASTVTLTGNTISNNLGAGGLFVDGGIVVLTNNNIIGNSSGGQGGGVYLTYSIATLTNNTINNNYANFKGGGVYVLFSTATLANNDISDNFSGLEGGGVYILDSTVTLIKNTIAGNSFSYYGGGVYANARDDTITLTNNIINNNSANFKGGGVWIDRGTAILTNNTITGNSAGTEGGGLRLRLLDDTNSANIYNNIIWANSAPQIADMYIDNDGNANSIPSPVSLFNNDFDQSSVGAYIQIPFPVDPSNLDTLDPLFVDPVNGNYHLTTDSPCIDAGDNTAPELPATDLDGKERILDGNGDGEEVVDIGGFEHQVVYNVFIDIKPRSDLTRINPKRRGVIPVAILTSQTFDATTVDPLSVEFGPSGAREIHERGHINDVDYDGDLDLVLHFKGTDSGIKCGDVDASLTGTTYDGIGVWGTDFLKTVGCR